MINTGKKPAIIDSSVLVAFFNKNDTFFLQSKSLLENQNAPVIIPDTVINESLALLRKRINKPTATQAGKQIFNSSFFQPETISSQTSTKTLNLFITKKAKYSYTDCSIIIIAKTKKLPILTFDKHFHDFNLTIFP